MAVKVLQRIALGALAGVSALALQACGDKAPEGQVVATVNGEEITLPEVNAEAQAANVPEGEDRKAAMRQIVQQIVNRKLLIGVAKEKGLDKSPDYLVQKHRADELILAEMVAKKQVEGLVVPGKAEIDKFIAENPTVFGDRKRYVLDQIRFARPADPKVLKQLEPAKSLDDVAGILGKVGVKFERGTAQLDSGSLPPQIMTRITQLSPTEPFVLPQGKLLTVSVIQGAQPIAVPPEAAQQIAGNALRQKKAAESVEGTIKAARDSAKITYQPGFEPPAEGAGKPGAAPAAAGAAPAAPAAQ